jgi:ArsR family transcriptional regulator, arsenate/arsenite/antimonite-responsive transcriptional repressor
MLTPEIYFRALADGTRLRCLLMLLAEERLCVCELVHALELSQPRVSRHLAQLRELGVVQDERQGQWVYYRLSSELPDWARQVLSAALAADSLADMRARLAEMPNRPALSCA